MIIRQYIGGETDVCLVTMPFVDLFRPSIALGLFKSALQPLPYRVSVVYANLLFAERVGLDRYVVQRLGSPLLHGGEWLFAGAAFPGHQTDIEAYVDLFARDVLRATGVEATATHCERMSALLLEVRRQASAFVDELADALLATSPRIVACTSTFQQHVASLALLRTLKERHPGIVTLLGGANCTGEMGIANATAFPWLDMVFSGEADDALPSLVDRIMRHGFTQAVSVPPLGAITQANVRTLGRAVPPPCAVLSDINRAAEPDYDDYFATLSRLSFVDAIVPCIALESSRGCWWGGKSGCIFCGLNGLNMSFRSKDPGRVMAEVERAAARYRTRRIEFVDNILDMRYFKTLLPELARAEGHYNLFFETKSNLSRDQVRALRAAGVRWIQPGIEGLHDQVLKTMHKGTDTATNIQLLKYGCEFGVRLTWHMLVGFPGEQDQWHGECAALVPLLHHLNPPTSLVTVIFQRFSAFHERPEQYGLQLKAPACLRSIYPLPEEQLDRLSYYFDNTADDAPNVKQGAGFLTLQRAITDWRNAWRMHEVSPILALSDEGESIAIYDTRACATERRVRLVGARADVLRCCEPAAGREWLAERIRERYDREWSPTELAGAVSELVSLRLLLEVSGKLLSLPIPGKIPELPTPQDFPGGLDAPMGVAALLRAG